MQTIKLVGQVDEQHRLSAQVPPNVVPGPVEVLLVVPDDTEDDAGKAWMEGIAREWRAELEDPREGIYTLEDGKPSDARRP